MPGTAENAIRRLRSWRPDRAQRIVGAVVVPVFVVELLLAWRTRGTFDLYVWRSFADTVARVGPIDIYSQETAGLMVYNHPPLVGWWLALLGLLDGIGIEQRFAIRMATAVAHALTGFLVLDVLRRRSPMRWAVASAVAVAVSPTLVIISGFHGNTDPIVVLLAIAAVHLLVDRRRPMAAGFAFSVAVSVKLIPVVALPLLALSAWALGWRDVRRFVLGGVPVFVLLWVPVLVLAGEGFLAKVLGYGGSGFPRQWGLYQLARSSGIGDGALALYAGPGTYLVLLLSALLPAWLVRNAPERAPAALGLCFALFLLLTPGWATQYNVYLASTAFLVAFWPALMFTAGGGLSYVVLYLQWEGNVQRLQPHQIPVLLVAWLAIVPVVVVGLRRLRRPSRVAAAPADGGLKRVP